MNELELCVRSPFNPLEVSLSTIRSALSHGFTLAVRDYENGELLGRFIPSTLTMSGFTFIKAGIPTGW